MWAKLARICVIWNVVLESSPVEISSCAHPARVLSDACAYPMSLLKAEVAAYLNVESALNMQRILVPHHEQRLLGAHNHLPCISSTS